MNLGNNLAGTVDAINMNRRTSYFQNIDFSADGNNIYFTGFRIQRSYFIRARNIPFTTSPFLLW